MALSNSSGLGTLKFDDVLCVLVSEKVWKKSLDESSVSGMAINIRNRGRSSIGGYESSRSKSKEHGVVHCFHYKEYDYIKKDYPKCVDRKKNDSPSIAVVEEEQDEYIGNVFIFFKGMGTFSYDKLILN